MQESLRPPSRAGYWAGAKRTGISTTLISEPSFADSSKARKVPRASPRNSKCSGGSTRTCDCTRRIGDASGRRGGSTGARQPEGAVTPDGPGRYPSGPFVGPLLLAGRVCPCTHVARRGRDQAQPDRRPRCDTGRRRAAARRHLSAPAGHTHEVQRRLCRRRSPAHPDEPEVPHRGTPRLGVRLELDDLVTLLAGRPRVHGPDDPASDHDHSHAA